MISINGRIEPRALPQAPTAPACHPAPTLAADLLAPTQGGGEALDEAPGMRRWTILAHADATTSDTEPFVLKRVAEIQAAPHEGTDVVVQVRRIPGRPTVDKMVGVAQLAGGLGACVASLALPFASSPWAALAIPVVGLVAYPFVMNGLVRFGIGQRYRPVHHEPAWTGTRTFVPTASPSGQKGVIDAPVVDATASTKAPDATELGRFLIRNMKAFPAQHTAVVVGGHAVVHQSVGDVALRDIAASLGVAERVTGEKVDVIMLEGCQTAELETLKKMAPYARYALVSEDVMNVTGLPWQRILKQASPLPEDPRAMVEAVAQAAGGRGGVPTLSAIDLEKVPALVEAVEELGRTLRDVAEQEGKKGLRTAFGDAPRLPFSLKGGFGAWSRGVNGIADLGSLLARFEQECPTAQVKEAVEGVKGALAAAVVSNAAATGVPASGVSIRVPALGFRERSYVDDTGMEQWGGLLQDMRPWHMRYTGIDLAMSAFA